MAVAAATLSSISLPVWQC